MVRSTRATFSGAYPHHPVQLGDQSDDAEAEFRTRCSQRILQGVLT